MHLSSISVSKTGGLFAVLLSAIMAFSGCKKEDSDKGNGYGTYSQSSGTVVQNGQTFFTSTPDISAVRVTGGTYNLTRSIVASTGNSSSIDNSNLYGLNAVMLAYSDNVDAIINSEGNQISSTGKGASGIFAYGKANINSKGDQIILTGEGSHAIMCNEGAIIKVEKDSATTSGANSAVIQGGIINILGGSYTSNGINSAAIHSKGAISCFKANLTANGSEAVIVEGQGIIALENCIVRSTFDKWGSLIFQGTAADASGTGGYFSMAGGSFTYTGKKGGMFYNTNSTSSYLLKGVTLINSCDTLLRVIKGSYGATSAIRGGTANFVADGQTMSGIIHVDQFSNANITLKNYSVFSGAINSSNTANLVTLVIDYSSKWTLTATSHINGLITNPLISGSSVQNITGNGFSLYYKSVANPSLGGQVYSLVNGGQLIPE